MNPAWGSEQPRRRVASIHVTEPVTPTVADLTYVARRRTSLLERAAAFVPPSDPLAAEIREALR